jgi:hypothetical protein
MNYPPTPEFIAKITDMFDTSTFSECINVETMKMVRPAKSHYRNGSFVCTTPGGRRIVDWCASNIMHDPVTASIETPRLFQEKTLERVMLVVQNLWVRMEELERENEQLRDTVRSIHRLTSD